VRKCLLATVLLVIACADERAPWPLCQWLTRIETAPGQWEERYCAYNGRGMMLCGREPMPAHDGCAEWIEPPLNLPPAEQPGAAKGE
jgi:hypothetical protein